MDCSKGLLALRKKVLICREHVLMDTGEAKRFQRKKRVIILLFLTITNLLGSGALALFFDRRFVWPAILLPVFFLLLLTIVLMRKERNGV